MKLYELTGLFMQFYDMLENAETENEISAAEIALQGLDFSIEEKIENYAMIIKNLEADIKAYKEEEARFKAKKQSAEKKVAWLKQTALEAMEFLGKEKVQSNLFSISIRNNAPSVSVLDESIVPKEYLIPQEPKLDKVSIKEAINSGVNVPGAELIRTRSLQIR